MKKTMKRILSLSLAVMLVIGLPPATALALDAKDVVGHWSVPAIEKRNTYGIMNGNGDVTTAPLSNISRERAFTILARVYKLASDENAATKFSHDAEISAWARASIVAFSTAGYVGGYNNNVTPKSTITRGETAQALVNLLGQIADVNTDDGTYKNLTIRKTVVTVKNATVTGDLFITDGMGAGDVTLTNVMVKGRTVITDGGFASIHANKSKLGNIIIDSRYNTHLDLSADTTVAKINFNSSGTVTHGTVSVSYDAKTGKMTFGGAIDKIVLNADGTATVAVGGIVYDIIPKVRNNAPKTTFEFGDKVAINIAVVDTTAVTASNSIVNEGDSAYISPTCDGNNESITKIVFTAPATGVISYHGVTQTAVNGKITINNFDSSKVLTYTAGEHVKGDYTLSYTATVKDNASGLSKDFTGSVQISVTPVTDTPVGAAGTASAPEAQAGHTAMTTVTLGADFADNSGTESHFFLVSLPVGLEVPNGWSAVTDDDLLSAADMSGTVYVVTANASGAGTFTLTVPENFAGDNIAFKAGASENALVSLVYEFSAEATAAVASTGAINMAPAAPIAEWALGEHDSSLSGALAITDPDGDTWTVTKVTFEGQDHNIPTDGSALQINGNYGILEIDAHSTYTYTLHQDVVATAVNALESFSYTITDQFGANADSLISITLGTPAT